jgi:hypothetical protein
LEEYDELASRAFLQEAVSGKWHVASRGRGSADATISLSQHDGTAQTVDRCNFNNGLGSIFNAVWATLEDWRPGLDSLPQMHAACRSKQLPCDDVFKVFHRIIY